MAVKKVLFPAKLKPTEAVQQSFTAELPEGTTKEDVLRPEFWVHVTPRIQPFAEINVFPSDGAWYGKVLVVHVDGNDISVKMLNSWDLEDDLPTLEVSSEYEVQRAGPVEKFRVVRKSDKQLMKTGFQTKALAMKYIVDDLRVAS